MLSLYDFSDLLFLCTLFLAAITDSCKKKIPNCLLLVGFSSLAVESCIWEKEKLVFSSLAAAGFVLLSMPLWRRSMIGGGDIKLFSLLFFWAPDMRGLQILFLSLLCAAAHGIYRLYRYKRFRERTAKLWRYCMTWSFADAGIRYEEHLDAQNTAGIPLAVSLLAGTVLAFLL